MLIRKWKDLPAFMQTDEVREYYDRLRKQTCSLILKRLFDIVCSLLLLLLLAPVFFFLAVMIKCDSSGSVFYRQKRVTQYGKTFEIVKFRTMVSNADQSGALLTLQNDSRITKVGKRIRKYRLDEIPQLINVLKGEMTFVQARPEVRKYVDAYTNEMNATLLLPAGITSYASIRYKDEDEILNAYAQKDVDRIYIDVVLSDKMKYNLEYLKNFSFLTDIRLCFKTVLAVCKK